MFPSNVFRHGNRTHTLRGSKPSPQQNPLTLTRKSVLFKNVVRCLYVSKTDETTHDVSIKQQALSNNSSRRNVISRLIIGQLALSTATPDAQARTPDEAHEVTFTQFLRYLEEGRVLQVDLYNEGVEAMVEVFPPDHGSHAQCCHVMLPGGATPELLRSMRGHQVNIAMHHRSESNTRIMLRMLYYIGLPLALLGSVLFMILRQGPMGMSRLPSKVQVERDTGVAFADVAGVDEAKEELSEIVEFLQRPEKFVSVGARTPCGCLLVGPPGTGKTLMARAIAGEAGVPFFCVSGSQFVEMFAGVGAARVRELFGRAKKESPCLVFIDEVDALGRARGSGIGSGSDEREQTLNQLLTEMDGFEGSSGIIVIAATNRADILDQALLRPGRFDRQVTVNIPDQRGRLHILQVHARGKALADDVSLEAFALRTPGLAGADLGNLMNEAAILAGRRGRSAIGVQELDDALERVVAGMEGQPLVDGRAKSLVAYHEAGHALCGTLQPGHDPVAKVTLVPRGQARGLTWFQPGEDVSLVSRGQMFARMVGALGGRAAEQVVFGEQEVTSGASGDLQQVASMARQMVLHYGMSDIGPWALQQQQGGGMSDALQKQVDDAVRAMAAQAYTAALAHVTANRAALDALAAALLEREALSGDEFRALLAQHVTIPAENLPGGLLQAGGRAAATAAERWEL